MQSFEGKNASGSEAGSEGDESVDVTDGVGDVGGVGGIRDVGDVDGVDREYVAGDITMVFSEYAGPPTRTFVLVHGIGMGRIVFAGLAKTLATHGRVLAVDLPGFGDSPESPIAKTLEETSVAVREFIEREASGRVTLIGHSMGTQIVAEVALHHPEIIEALILIAPTVNLHERTVLKQGERMLQDLSSAGPKVLLVGMWQYLKTNPLWFAEKLRFMLQHKLELIAPKLTVPTLVLRGETDKVCPRDWVSEIAELIPNSEMSEIPDRGHGAMIESPEPTASMVLEFVERQR